MKKNIKKNSLLASELLGLNDEEKSLLVFLANWGKADRHALENAGFKEFIEGGFPYWVSYESEKAVLSPVLLSFIFEDWPMLPDGVRLKFPEKTECFAIDEEADELVETINRGVAAEKKIAFIITGKAGSGRDFFADKTAEKLELNILDIDGSAVIKTSTALNEIKLAAQLYNAAPVIKIEGNTGTHINTAIFETINGFAGFYFVISEDGRSNEAIDAITQEGRTAILRNVPEPTLREREEAFDKLAATATAQCKPDDIKALKEKLLGKRLPFATWLNLVKSLVLEAELGCLEDKLTDNYLRLEKEHSDNLQFLPTNRRAVELCLPEAQQKQIFEIIKMCRARDKVLYSWGFDRKFAYGNGLSILFYGAPGTGKTMAAQVIAKAIGKPLYRIDLSQLTSKYIGETQKNIGRIFDEAAALDCVLLFDEADAIFTRRSDVSDAQDKYSNAETAYLLQRIESFSGIAILTTNLFQNFDEAFRRRISYMVRFPMPDESARLKLWKNIFPENTPVSEDVSFETLAKLFEISGASIRNAAMQAALLTGDDAASVGMPEILSAIRSEFFKTGKTLSNDQEELMKSFGV